MSFGARAFVGVVPIVAAVLVATGCGGGQSGDDYAERMAREHAEDAPIASEAAIEEPAGEVETTEVAYATVEGNEVTGYLAVPAGEALEGAPGLIVIQEWWGLNDNIRAMARRLAGEGYVALAVDLYEGRSTADPAEARELMSAAMGRTSALQDNLRQAYEYLRDQRGVSEVGSIGWCFGGGWSLETALMLGDQLDAAVIYYGRLPSEASALEGLQAPVLGIFGGSDRGIPVESVRAFESMLADLGKTAQIHVYEGADHAFANPSGTRYDAEAAADAWAKTLAFLDRELRN